MRNSYKRIDVTFINKNGVPMKTKEGLTTRSTVEYAVSGLSCPVVKGPGWSGFMFPVSSDGTVRIDNPITTPDHALAFKKKDGTYSKNGTEYIVGRNQLLASGKGSMIKDAVKALPVVKPTSISYGPKAPSQAKEPVASMTYSVMNTSSSHMAKMRAAKAAKKSPARAKIDGLFDNMTRADLLKLVQALSK